MSKRKGVFFIAFPIVAVLLEAEDYEAAYPLFLELGDYKDSAEYAADFFLRKEKPSYCLHPFSFLS